jgi:hypothetical protein
MAEQTREHTLRAAGADRSFQRFLAGKFPSRAPDLRAGAWRLTRAEREGGGAEYSLAPAGAAPGAPGPSSFRGAPDAGLAGDGASASNYFILYKRRGSDDFVALPVSRFATFRPHVARGASTLEDAEAAMKHQRLQAGRANPRLAAALGAGEGGGGAAAAAAGGAAAEDGPDSDEEWKDIRAKALSRVEGAGAPGGGAPRPRAAGGDDEDDEAGAGTWAAAVGGALGARPAGAEDWEHEEEAADDDLDAATSEGEEGGGSPERGPVVVSDDEGGGGGGPGGGAPRAPPRRDAAWVKRDLRAIMKKTGLEDTDDEEEEGEESGEGRRSASASDGSGDEDEDLDAMADAVLPAPPPPAAGAKRRSPPPAEQGAAKRPRAASPPAPRAPSLPVAPAAAAAAAAAACGLPTEAEVAALLHARGRLSLADAVATFKARLAGAEARRAFTATVKAVARMETAEDGKKYLVLK